MEVKVIKRKDIMVDSKTGVERKLNVAAYARVSTDQEDQKTSFESQQSYYLEKIYNNPKWNFVDIYADEGISGTMTAKRENFLRMINDAMCGKIDLILTKSISRFARNTLDTLTYVRELRNKNVGVIFEEEGINTLEMAGELLLTVLSSVAQQESENTSSRVRMGIKMKRERGELVGFNSCYGYIYNSKKNTLTINEQEAEVVKMIFSSYLEGMGSTTIASHLTQMDIPSPRKTGHWSYTTIIDMLQNEKYVGDVIQGKTYTVDVLAHKRATNNGEEDKYIIKDHHEAIIDRETFNKVQDMLNTRNANRKTGRKLVKKFTFSGRFRCGFCGKSYVKKSLYKKNLAWDCVSVAKEGRDLCNYSKLIHEETIKSCFMDAYSLLTANDGLVLEEFVHNLKQSIRDRTPLTMMEKVEENILTIRRKRDKLIDLLISETIDEESFEKKNKELDARIEKLKEKKAQLADKVTEKTKIELNVSKIKTELMLRETDSTKKEFDEDLFNALIDYGIIGGINENGEKEPYMIRFICKNGLNHKSRYDITDDLIIANSNLSNTENSIYVPILDFSSNQHFYTFTKVNNRLRKTLIKKVRVRLEIEKNF